MELDAGVMRKSVLPVSFAVINIINLGSNLYKCITEAYEFVAKKNTFFVLSYPIMHYERNCLDVINDRVNQ